MKQQSSLTGQLFFFLFFLHVGQLGSQQLQIQNGITRKHEQVLQWYHSKRVMRFIIQLDLICSIYLLWYFLYQMWKIRHATSRTVAAKNFSILWCQFQPIAIQSTAFTYTYVPHRDSYMISFKSCYLHIDVQCYSVLCMLCMVWWRLQNSSRNVSFFLINHSVGIKDTS